MLSGLLLVTLSLPASAQLLLPLTTETAAPVSSGTTQLVLGASYFKNRRWPPFTPPGFLRSQNLVSGPELGFRVGAGGWVEIQATYEFIYLDEERSDGTRGSTYGGGDARLFTKVRLLRERSRWPGLGLRFGVKIPNANRKDRLGTDEADFLADALASKDLGPLAVHVNLGIAILGNPGPLTGVPSQSGSGQDDLFTYSLAIVSEPVAKQVTGPYELKLGAEVSGWAGARSDNDRSAVRAGFQLSRGGWTTYLGASGGLAQAAEKFGVMAGLIYTFQLERLAALFE